MSKCRACFDNTEEKVNGLCVRCHYIIEECKELMKEEEAPLLENIYADPRVQKVLEQMMPSLN